MDSECVECPTLIQYGSPSKNVRVMDQVLLDGGITYSSSLKPCKNINTKKWIAVNGRKIYPTHTYSRSYAIGQDKSGGIIVECDASINNVIIFPKDIIAIKKRNKNKRYKLHRQRMRKKAIEVKRRREFDNKPIWRKKYIDWTVGRKKWVEEKVGDSYIYELVCEI